MKIYLSDGTLANAEYLRHLRTLTHGSGCTSGHNLDLDLFRLADGTEVVCSSRSNDARSIPTQVEKDDTLPGYD